MWLKMAKSDASSNTAFICFWLPKSVESVMCHIDGLDKNLHMTLLYLESGVDTEKDRKMILESVEEVSSRFSPLKCKFEELGMMKNGDNSLVANINIEQGAELYTDLVDTISNKWKHFDRKYNFLPHCTLKYENKDKTIDLSDLRKFEWKSDEISVQFSKNGKKHKFKLNGEK